MERDERWVQPWAEVRPWKGHPGWVKFYMEVAPGSYAEATCFHDDDLAMGPRVFHGVLDHLVKSLDESMDRDHFVGKSNRT